MTTYIAELDETLQVSAVWIKETSARAPRVFDPQRHAQIDATAAEFHGAPREKIQRWIARAQAASNDGLSRAPMSARSRARAR